MKKINFLFGIHCHQPVGNFEHVFEGAYKDCYLPFLETMERHPRIKFTAHYSGILYDWFAKSYPEFLDLIAKLVRRGQLEMMTGGYYEPIIPVIPDEDKLGQIAMMNKFLQKHFRSAATGMWLAERIWEPNLPSVLKEAGIEYVTVDDYHFISAGVPKDKLFGYYITEDQGNAVKVFPISKELRYLVPFRLPAEAIRYLSEIATEEGNKAAILADDGEKFGVWPGTNKWVYHDGYLENLLAELEKNLEWIRPMTFCEYAEEFPPAGRVYLPTASYFEMMQWVLPPASSARLDSIMSEAARAGKTEQFSEFFKGGFFRNFFVKYPESNNMHKKMLLVSQKLATLKKSHANDDRGRLLERAENDLYKGQCNCAYWHGVFGGLYLSNLRHAIYEHLIRAENALQKLQRGDKKYTELLITDFDRDGREDLILSNPYLNLYISPGEGGGMFEADFKPKEFNFLNVLTRREEAYHAKILDGSLPDAGQDEAAHSIHGTAHAKEGGIKKYLIYDRNRRVSLVDHFYHQEVDGESIRNGSCAELGDFAGKPYEFFPVRKSDEVEVLLSRTAEVLKKQIKVSKRIILLSGLSKVFVEYEVANLSSDHFASAYGVEFNVNLLAGDASDRYYEFPRTDIKKAALNTTGSINNIKEVRMVDEWKGFSVSFETSEVSELIRFPIETVSQSEGGFERTHQGSSLHFIWNLELKPQETWKNKFVIQLTS